MKIHFERWNMTGGGYWLNLGEDYATGEPLLTEGICGRWARKMGWEKKHVLLELLDVPRSDAITVVPSDPPPCDCPSLFPCEDCRDPREDFFMVYDEEGELRGYTPVYDELLELFEDKGFNVRELGRKFYFAVTEYD